MDPKADPYNPKNNLIDQNYNGIGSKNDIEHKKSKYSNNSFKRSEIDDMKRQSNFEKIPRVSELNRVKQYVEHYNLQRRTMSLRHSSQDSY